jgi:adenosylcobinamide-phosphate synthase
LAVLAAALTVDLLLGEFPRAVHPVVWMGKMIRWLERRAPSGGPAAELAFGTLMAIAVPFAFAAAGAAVLALASHSPVLSFAVEVYLLKATFALAALGSAARVVRVALVRENLAEARAGLRSLCSRDPSTLDGAAVAAGAIESVAENASDSFVAPLLFFALFGIPGALAYRAINTLDARIGYHGRYEWLGKASARLDDIANFIPARLTAALLVVAGAIAGGEVRRAVAVWRRDAGSTESPNAGRPMAVMAGLLRVRLAKPGHYALGDSVDALAPTKIADAWRIVQLGAALHIVVVAMLLGARRVL